MPAELLIRSLVCVTLVCCIAAGSAPADPQPDMLTADSFAKARAFIERTARPLERALFSFQFADGSRDAVIAELAKFQNPDGGFATYLESDAGWTGSSPMATKIGLRIFNQIGAPADDVHVRAAVRYLLATFDDRKGYWHAVPKAVNSAPHAPWWGFHEKIGRCEVESPVFPTAAIAGYLQPYAALLPEGFLDGLVKSSLRYLSAAPVNMAMPDIEMLTELVRLLPPGSAPEAVEKLRSVLAVSVVRDPRKWDIYGVQPLTFVHSPGSPFYPGLESTIAVNLNYIVATQKPDGDWVPNWSWEKDDPVAWRRAEREWRGILTLEKLERLRAFHRIEGLD